MLAIRLQRTGRKGHSQFRLVVQESRVNPSSRKVVAYLGNYNPHTKEAIIDKEKAELFMSNGAQPSDSVARLFSFQKIKLPKWVVIETNQKRAIKSPDKLRKNRPEEPKKKPQEEPAETITAEPNTENNLVVENESVGADIGPEIDDAAPDVSKTEKASKSESVEEPKAETEDK